MSWRDEQDALRAAGMKARLEEQQRRDEQFLKARQRGREASTGATRAAALLAGLKGKTPSLRSIMEKSQANADEFGRLEREVERGRPMTSLGRALFEREKARREGESGAADAG
ncbi:MULTISPECIES: hypothetical protein [unclassified Micromonospora]|uniref:hypothetical protein n=1 Tax=unclassified Micromonospora TaxID=2617518 RepID=UPI00098D6C2D|nr:MULTISPECIES: hypothetical protein [unclassified Micromonospora]MDI5937021.1 hypothetical protein [Micromonospora sp. DH15]OON33400.1 hypothetical protein BSA16_00645 [Micromonospora sp. Rc5]